MNRYQKRNYQIAARIAKAERRVISTAMKLHNYNPPHSDLDEYRSHRDYLTSQLHRACNALTKAKQHRPIDSGKVTR